MLGLEQLAAGSWCFLGDLWCRHKGRSAQRRLYSACSFMLLALGASF